MCAYVCEKCVYVFVGMLEGVGNPVCLIESLWRLEPNLCPACVFVYCGAGQVAGGLACV